MTSPTPAAPSRPVLAPVRRVTATSRVIGRLAIPVTLLLLFHAWLGRGLFGAYVGWGIFIFPMFYWWMVPLALGPGVLASVRPPKGRRGGVGRAEATLQVLTWVALFVWGLAVTDFGDAPGDSGSALSAATALSTTQIAGIWRVSSWLCVACPVLQLVLGVALGAVWPDEDGGTSTSSGPSSPSAVGMQPMRRATPPATDGPLPPGIS